MILTEALIINKARGMSRTTTTKDLSNMKSLNLWGQHISDISVLQSLPDLQVVSLAVNNIKDLSPFGSMRNLRELYLRKNLVSDPAQLLHLVNLPLLSHFWLEDNPVCSKIPQYRTTMLRLFPNLVRFDDQDVTPRERRNAQSQGPLSPQEKSSIFGTKPMTPSFAEAETPTSVSTQKKRDSVDDIYLRSSRDSGFAEGDDGSPFLHQRNVHLKNESLDEAGKTLWEFQKQNYQMPPEDEEMYARRRLNIQARSVPEDINFGAPVSSRMKEDHIIGAGVIDSFDWSMPNGKIMHKSGVKNDAVGGTSGLNRRSYTPPERTQVKGFGVKYGDHQTLSPSMYPRHKTEADAHFNVNSGIQVVGIKSLQPRSRIPHTIDMDIEHTRNDPQCHLAGASTRVEPMEEKKNIRRQKADFEDDKGHVRGAGMMIDANSFPVVEARRGCEITRPKTNQRPNWLTINSENVIKSIRDLSNSDDYDARQQIIEKQTLGASQDRELMQGKAAMEKVEKLAVDLLKTAESLNVSVVLGIMDVITEKIQVGGQGYGRDVLDKLRGRGLELSDVFAECALGGGKRRA